MPLAMVGALSGLADGRFPLRGRSRYAGAIDRRDVTRRVRAGESPARLVEDAEDRDFMDIEGRPRAQVVAVNDGEILRIERRRHGRRFRVRIEDIYGNRYTYSGLRRVARGYAVPGRKRGTTRLKRLRRGASVPGGTVLGRLPERRPVLRFAIRPAGDDAPAIDPKPILDGWRLLEKTAIYRPSGRNVLHPERSRFTVGQAILLPKALLVRRVLADSRIQVYPCGRADIASGRIDRRVLALLAYLAESGLHPTVTSLQCGHGYYTASGNVSHHSTGTAVDIAAINGTPIMGHQQPGGITELAVRRIMLLQGAMAPAQVISLFDLGGPTISMGDHADHIHVGFTPGSDAGHGSGDTAGAAAAVLEATQWDALVGRVGEIPNPRLRISQARAAVAWHGPANASCKYDRAMVLQGGRGTPEPLRQLEELVAGAEAPKRLVTVAQLGAAPRPCFGFGTPGTLAL
jgi:hypothetical protein